MLSLYGILEYKLFVLLLDITDMDSLLCRRLWSEQC